MKLGILSDTHDLLRPEVLSALSGVDAILHAGDIGSRRILDQLKAAAPLYAVRGNADRADRFADAREITKEFPANLPEFQDIALDGIRIFMTHKKKDLPKDLSPYDLVVVGHSHQYAQTQQGRTVILNPGSCGPRRFYQPVTMALATAAEGKIDIRRIDIAQAAPAPETDPGDMKALVETVMKQTAKGRGPKDIAKKCGIEEALAEQIVRLYVTHPGVTAEGILGKMGL